MIRGVLLVVEVLLWLLLLRFVSRTIAFVFARPRMGAAARRDPPRARAAEDLVLDRVCHTYLPRSRAISARISGRDEPFCSAACRDRALAALSQAS